MKVTLNEACQRVAEANRFTPEDVVALDSALRKVYGHGAQPQSHLEELWLDLSAAAHRTIFTPAQIVAIGIASAEAMSRTHNSQTPAQMAALVVEIGRSIR